MWDTTHPAAIRAVLRAAPHGQRVRRLTPAALDTPQPMTAVPARHRSRVGASGWSWAPRWPSCARACLAALQAEVAKCERYRRPEPLPLWRVRDAIARITGLLPELHGTVPFERFLPQVAPEPPDYALRCRSAVASTLVARLELVRGGELTLVQEESFGAIKVRAVQGAAGVEAAHDNGGGNTVLGGQSWCSGLA